MQRIVIILRPFALLIAAVLVGTPGLVEAIREQAVEPWQHAAILASVGLAALWTRKAVQAPTSFVESVQALDLEPDDTDDVVALVNLAWVDGHDRGFAEGVAARVGAAGPHAGIDGSGR